MAKDISAAYASYLLADPDHRRGSAEALLALPDARSFILDQLKSMPSDLAEQRAVLWQLAVIDAIGRLADNDDVWLRTALAWLDEAAPPGRRVRPCAPKSGFKPTSPTSQIRSRSNRSPPSLRPPPATWRRCTST